MKIRQVSALIVLASTLLISCEKDDFTGHSKLKPTSPIITVTIPPQVDLDDLNQYVWDITVTLSVAQIVDVAIYSVQMGGDAVAHDDYDIEERLIIPKGETVGTFTLEILSADLDVGPKTLTLKIGDTRTANAKITPVSFTIDRNP